jgi:hypothetical protein
LGGEAYGARLLQARRLTRCVCRALLEEAACMHIDLSIAVGGRVRVLVRAANSVRALPVEAEGPAGRLLRLLVG